MNDNRTLAIATMSITAVILLVANIMLPNSAMQQAQAIGQTDRGGDYIVVTGQFTNSTELVYVTDAATHRLVAYSFDFNQGAIRLWDWHDLGRELGRGAKRDDDDRGNDRRKRD